MIRIKTSGIVSQSLLVCTLTLRPCRLDTKLIKRRDWTPDHPQGEEEEYSWRVNLIKIFEILGILMPLTKTICYSCARRICQTPLTCDLYEPALLAQHWLGCKNQNISFKRKCLTNNKWQVTGYSPLYGLVWRASQPPITLNTVILKQVMGKSKHLLVKPCKQKCTN